jgi:integrase
MVAPHGSRLTSYRFARGAARSSRSTLALAAGFHAMQQLAVAGRLCCSPPPRVATSASTPGGRASGIRRSRRPGCAGVGPYQLRHTFATEALAAGISIFELARVMGASVKTIDKHYGHLARDSEQAIRARLDARAARTGDVVATDGDKR